MMKLIKLLIIFLTPGILLSQNINIGDPGYPLSNTIPCNTFSNGSTPNFFDDGGSGANYSANYNDTITFCPDLNQGTKVSLVYGINAGFSFDVHGSDSIYVFDGPNTNSPLMGVHNSVTDPNGFTHTASWNNPTGCITVVFISDGANEGSGWEANVSCGNPAQPFEVHIEAYINGTGSNALNPLDTGFVDICFEDSILFIAKPIFPYSFETTGYGYSQNVDNVIYDWNISTGLNYPNNDSIWFTPPARQGYLVDLKITDAFPQSERILCKVRVSQLPLFTGTGPLEDSVCLGENTVLIGGHTSTDTVGVDIPPGTFNLGGSFAGLTYLPDGSGAQYQAPINISGFPSGSTIQNSQSLNQVCITIEHSYLGDLEIALQCPNGTVVPLVNSYSPGFIPGGFGGGGIFLGDADDNSGNGTPGIGWEYCFSSVFNTWGDMGTELANNNTVPAPLSGGQSMNPNGVYLPEQDFSAFAGCPVNGTWTIIVQDNLTIDDGYIFEWGLFFDASYFPGLSGYQNTIVDSYWHDDPSIISGQNDTAIVIQPNTTGMTNYTFEITDDFGCTYDTVVGLYVLPQPTIFNDTIACNFGIQVTGVTSFSGGYWNAADTAVHFNTAGDDNPYIYTYGVSGPFTVTYTDSACNSSVSAIIDFYDVPYTDLQDTVICAGSNYHLDVPNNSNYPTTFTWSNGLTGNNVTFDNAGTYYLEVSNECHTHLDTITIGYKTCNITPPNVISLVPGSPNNEWFVKTEGIKDIEIFITNRWGNIIYECSSSNPSECKWDGTNQKTGKKVAEGTYFYIVRAVTEGDEEIEDQGFIKVID